MVAAALAVVVALMFAAETLAASEEIVGQHKGKLKKQMEAVVMEVMLWVTLSRVMERLDGALEVASRVAVFGEVLKVVVVVVVGCMKVVVVGCMKLYDLAAECGL